MTRDPDLIGIVGAGPFGLALAAMCGRAGRKTILWSHAQDVVDEINGSHSSARMPDLELPSLVRATTDVDEFAASARFLVIAVSSDTLRPRMHTLGNSVSGAHIAVHAIGAFSTPRDQRVSEVIAEETPILRIGVIAGPSMAADIAAGRGTSLVCASEFTEVTSECCRLLSVPPVMRMYRGSDMIGAELASSLSGAYTISLGLADALKVGIGIRAVLVTRAISEMSRLGQALGANPQTFAGLAGLGNLLVRSSVEGGHQSPSYSLGVDLAAGKPANNAVEGARAAHAGARLAESAGLRLPILQVTARVLAGEMEPSQAAAEILKTVAAEE